jgi:hypothetical protein
MIASRMNSRQSKSVLTELEKVNIIFMGYDKKE